MRKHLATLVEDFERHGNQVAIVSYPGNRRVVTTYAELATLAGRFSRMLADRGIAPGERVLLWGANSAEWVAAFFGCVMRGVIAVPLDAAGSIDFAARVIADVTPRLIVGDQAHLQKLSQANSVPTEEVMANIAFEDFSSTLPRSPMFEPDPSLNPETPLQILFTSGTTSAPKGIVHTHGNVLSSVEVLEREIKKYLRYERWVHPLRFLHTLPLSHVFGQFMGLWVPPLLAAQVHYEDNLVASHVMERIRRERISVAAVVPRVLELLRVHLLSGDPRLQRRVDAVQNQRVWKKWWHMRDVHRRFGFKFWAFVSGGASLPAEVEQFWNALGFVLVQGYGMTETTALATLNHPMHPTRGSIGKPLAGREVRVAEDGEILVRGPMLAAGTWRNGGIEPRSGEWLHTGDLGAVDASGQMRFLGRKSDVIVAASGMNIHPEDLEQVVQTQPGVRDCVVVGWESARGPEPVAVVILQDRAEDASLTQILSNSQQHHGKIIAPRGGSLGRATASRRKYFVDPYGQPGPIVAPAAAGHRTETRRSRRFCRARNRSSPRQSGSHAVDHGDGGAVRRFCQRCCCGGCANASGFAPSDSRCPARHPKRSSRPGCPCVSGPAVSIAGGTRRE
jgi:long-chain acyl-CoA synthetase